MSCPAPLQPSATLQAALRRAGPGQVVGLDGLDTNAGRRLNLAVADGGQYLLFSNDPEDFTQPNRVLARDPALPQGDSRVFFHHRNGTGRDQRVVLVARGGPGGSWVAVRRRGLAGPWGDPLVVGRRTFYRWLSDNQSCPALRLAEGEAAVLDPPLASLVVAPGQTIGGIFDLGVFPGGPPEVAVVACDPEVPAERAYPSLLAHPRNGGEWVRGTAATCDRLLDTAPDGRHDPQYDTSWGVACYRVADGVEDPFLAVTDRLTPSGDLQPLAGNYGLLYRFHLWMTGSDGRAVALLVNPRGTDYGGAIKLAPGLDAGGDVYLPWAPDSLADPFQAVLAGRYLPGQGHGLWMQFMVPGGSNAPINLALVPYSPA